MARCRRVEEGLHCYWRHPARLPAYFDSDVYIREEMQDVDRAEEPDGEVLSWFTRLEVLVSMAAAVDLGRCFGQALCALLEPTVEGWTLFRCIDCIRAYAADVERYQLVP